MPRRQTCKSAYHRIVHGDDAEPHFSAASVHGQPCFADGCTPWESCDTFRIAIHIAMQIWLVCFKHLDYFPFHHIWDVILPIDELIFFKMGRLHHQPEMFSGWDYRWPIDIDCLELRPELMTAGASAKLCFREKKQWTPKQRKSYWGSANIIYKQVLYVEYHHFHKWVVNLFTVFCCTTVPFGDQTWLATGNSRNHIWRWLVLVGTIIELLGIFQQAMFDWVNYNELTTSSLEIIVSKGNHPQMAQQFRLVNYYNLPRCLIGFDVFSCSPYLLGLLKIIISFFHW